MKKKTESDITRIAYAKALYAMGMRYSILLWSVAYFMLGAPFMALNVLRDGWSIFYVTSSILSCFVVPILQTILIFPLLKWQINKWDKTADENEQNMVREKIVAIKPTRDMFYAIVSGYVSLLFLYLFKTLLKYK